MSTSEPDFEQLLRQAIQKAKESAPRAVADLHHFSSQAAEAVDRVTGGSAALDLVPINQESGAPTAYQLQLRKVNSEAPASDLGVYLVSTTGYPIHRWYSRKGWEARPDKPEQEFIGSPQLASNFEWIVSNPESRLVVLVTFFQEQNRAAAGTPDCGELTCHARPRERWFSPFSARSRVIRLRNLVVQRQEASVTQRQKRLAEKLAANRQRWLRTAYLEALPVAVRAELEPAGILCEPHDAEARSHSYVSASGLGYESPSVPAGYAFREFSWPEQVFAPLADYTNRHDVEPAYLRPFHIRPSPQQVDERHVVRRGTDVRSPVRLGSAPPAGLVRGHPTWPGLDGRVVWGRDRYQRGLWVSGGGSQPARADLRTGNLGVGRTRHEMCVSQVHCKLRIPGSPDKNRSFRVRIQSASGIPGYRGQRFILIRTARKKRS